jgi:hydroxymethylbilane synthase
VDGDRIRLLAIVAAPDGSELIRGESEGRGAQADQLGRSMGDDLLRRGAREILESVYHESAKRT